SAYRSPQPIAQVEERSGSVITTTTYFTSTAPLGALDPALGPNSWLATSILILVFGSAVELALIIWYGSYYLGRPESKHPLALPIGTVRVFLILLVFISVILFTLLPTSWSENRAAISLANLFAAVVGFYFGNAAARENKSNSDPSNTDKSTDSDTGTA